VVERLGADSLIVREVPVLIHGTDVEMLVHRICDISLQLEESAGVSSDSLAEVLVKWVVEMVPMTSLAEADRLLRELETLPEQGRGLWRLLPASQLAQWLAAKG
jgi:hypothetical protein